MRHCTKDLYGDIRQEEIKGIEIGKKEKKHYSEMEWFYIEKIQSNQK